MARTLELLTPAQVLAPHHGGPKTGVFTDGSCEGNPGPGGWGYVWVEDDRIVLVRHESNRGKGAAIRTALAAATGDYVLIQDADLEYRPEDYPRLLKPLLAGCEVVYGSRFLGKQRSACRKVNTVRHPTRTTNCLRKTPSCTGPNGTSTTHLAGRCCETRLAGRRTSGRQAFRMASTPWRMWPRW